MLVLALCWLSVSVWASNASPQKLSEVIGHGDLLGASTLAYFNTNERARDERSLTAAYSSLHALEMCMAHLGQPVAQTQALAQMKLLLAKLELLPAAQRERYPELLQQFLTEQQKFRHAAATAYAEVREGSDSIEQMLSAQSHDLAHLLLDYQIRHYPEVATGRQTLSVAQRETLTASIEQRFQDLRTSQPEQAEVLGKINSQYRFIRSQVLSPDGRLQAGVEFYLSRAVLDLQELSAR
ncbi:hypothetical protein [Pseudomonas sp. 5P_3.1_Bac2]|uniref:hypothetical protein n=1 Tax=Pseudomonas sp. 5P_3.1_Bac2 TaxID=2971617 RepID=UPI0021C72824|nr:hypothetical protein [Pseudomonas sp. 5P_3.1_Bac2]MCU1717648.1 hypothetical protein [Pseudomonas sp. 5P_3.1_Bac2]